MGFFLSAVLVMQPRPRIRAPSLPVRLLRRLIDRVFWAAHRDYVSGLRIARRSDLIDLGSASGGWIVPARLLGADSVCYCAGCGEDITFDLALIRRFGCRVWGFDPTPRAAAHVKQVAADEPRYRFTPVGVWDDRDRLPFFAPANPRNVSHSLLNLQGTDEHIEIPVESLESLMKERNHTRLDLLKIDIEGAEYRVLDHMLERSLDVRVLLAEYDECFSPLDDMWLSRIRDSVGKLDDAGFRLVGVRGRGNFTFVRMS